MLIAYSFTRPTDAVDLISLKNDFAFAEFLQNLLSLFLESNFFADPSGPNYQPWNVIPHNATISPSNKMTTNIPEMALLIFAEAEFHSKLIIKNS